MELDGLNDFPDFNEGWFLGSSPYIIVRGVRGGKNCGLNIEHLYRHEVGESHSYTVGEEYWGIFYFSGSWIRSWMSSIHRFIWMLKCCPNLESSDPMNLPFCAWWWEPYRSKQIQTIRKASCLWFPSTLPLQSAKGTIFKKMVWRAGFPNTFVLCVNQVSIHHDVSPQTEMAAHENHKIGMSKLAEDLIHETESNWTDLSKNKLPKTICKSLANA